ncbi:MAG: polyribonucleotide nucleotidyltransferase [Eubacteriales bacterium]|jgi:polyribonucleotide nucleotidyltransferase|nr:polyribonucleotide nucleotidyltransferase [Eubacteriales bacterium]NLF47401.1 polyribonucleotide nucleotidyltransferase [Clostridiales bacterium]
MRFEDYKTFRTAIGGKLMEMEIGKVCEQANGQVMVRYGDTVVNVTAVMSKDPRPDIDFFPLSCDYEEKMYAAGKIPGGFIKREGRPSEKAILNSRLMDRPLRPLFPKGFFNDVQVVATVMCMDNDAPSEIAAMIGSSVALSVSDIPWDGPTGSVLVGRVNGEFVINPTSAEREISDIHMVVSGTKEAIMMVEAGADEVAEADMLDGIMFAHEEIKKIVTFIEEIVEEVGKTKKEMECYKVPDDIEKDVREYAEQKMRAAVLTVEKQERLDNMDAVEVETQEYFSEKYPEAEKDIANILYTITKEQVRRLILDDGIRPDNRKHDEIRPIWVETGVLPRCHGTGLFKRGQTQALSVATLGPVREGQRLDGISEETEKRYMHHYNFPAYSVGETKPMRSPGRREIGHGALAERAIIPVLPEVEDFPYAIRVVSEILSSNGSTSMASTCGSCLALMDAGVPIKAPVAGIAMGLIERVEEDGSSKMAILSDIQGMEDFLGDMDFKVAGTEKGINAIQMDIKVHGLSRDILEKALSQAKEGRMHILKEMMSEITEPRAELSPWAPRIISMQIDIDKIRTVIGPGGKTINGIIDKTGVKIDIDDDGLVYIAAPDMESAEKGLNEIEMLIKEVEVGEVYNGKVVRIMNFGAFIEILPGKDGLLHISKMAKHRVEKVEDIMNIGDEVEVKVTEIDGQGRINLLRTQLPD